MVEDDEFLREIYIDSLKSTGYFVDFAVDGEEALAKIRSGGWDLVLLDIVLPKLDGITLVRKIKTEGNKYAKSYVFLTNIDSGDQLKEAAELGNGYLIKNSLTPKDFRQAVEKYLLESQKS